PPGREAIPVFMLESLCSTGLRLLLYRSLTAGAVREKFVKGESMDAAEPILVVDDDAECRAVVTGLLQRVGYRALEAQTGEEALATLNGQRPALVLLEVALPGLSGYEVCRELRPAFGEELPINSLTGPRAEA